MKELLNFLAYADGTNDLIDIGNTIQVPFWRLVPIVKKLKEAELIEEANGSDYVAVG